MCIDPILVVNETIKGPQNLMIAYDGSRESDKALDRVATSCSTEGCAATWSASRSMTT